MVINIFKKRMISKTKGFTLLELLIYITILSGVMIVSSNMFISLSKGQGKTSAKSEVDSSVRFAGELIRQDLKNASVVSTPSVGVPSSTLILTRSISGVPTTITYDVVSGVLRRKEGAALAVNITNSNVIAGTPTFTRIENTNLDFASANTTTSIKINMVFSYNSSSPDWSYSTAFQTSVSLYPQ